MRDCPICSESSKKVIYNDYDNRELSHCLWECPACGHRYVDNKDWSQAWFDNYYLKYYTTDVAKDSETRWRKLAGFVWEEMTGPLKTVLDIGGLDGHLGKFIQEYGFKYQALGVMGEPEGKFDAVILSHTLEHIYDVQGAIKRAKKALAKRDGLLVIEVPIHRTYGDPTYYDYHWQHINKFRPQDLRRLFETNGLLVTSSRLIEPYNEYHCWRIAGKVDVLS